MTILDILIIGVAAWRISVFVTSGVGPWQIAVKVRKAFDVQHDEEGEIVSSPTVGPGKMITCVWCVSLWIVAFFVPMYNFFPFAIGGFAAWGVVGIIQGLVFRDD